jgi:UDP-N-acetylglucosamine 2-epimerase (non-hydrolysing)
MQVLFFFGTRPEAIKLAPVIAELRKYPGSFSVNICVSAQHREMLDQTLAFFDIRPDFDLNIMRPDQDLFDVTTNALKGAGEVMSSCKPDWLFVQGDTTTTFAGALAACYGRVRVAHVEAGLRSFNNYSPFPEEINRVLTTHLSDIHFAPTPGAKDNLVREGVPEDRIHVVGNTGIDALFLCLEKVSGKGPGDFGGLRPVDFTRRIVLVTGHRRESFGKPFEEICLAVKQIGEDSDVEIVYPVHLNPNVRRPVFGILGGVPNIHLMEPLEYPAFVWLMSRSHIILTDSGGVQEEAPSLGKPVLVMRDVTERLEGVEAGTARLVGTNKDRIVREASRLLNDTHEYEAMAKAANPYGDGKASARISKLMDQFN